MRMSRNSGKILWGLLFLLGAVYLIASKIWSLPGISVFNVILGVFCVWVLIEGIRHVNFWRSFSQSPLSVSCFRHSSDFQRLHRGRYLAQHFSAVSDFL